MSHELWLVRHAETEWSVARKHTGRTDIPLTEAGRTHARTLAPVLAEQDFALVLCSPLRRARETAELAGLGPRVALRDGLLEYDYGAYEGITTDEIRRERPDWLLWRDGVPDGESPDDVGARVDTVIAEARAADGNVVCVAHGHVLRVLAARWLGEPAAFGGKLALSTGAVCVLGWEREMPVMWRWNDVAGAPGA
ncbi:MAG: histidine phosphatase family protein [Solirubrobacterales bacterium]|nr:histidine phosphatase family protein [Solirubrobacterales bacterium]